MQRVLAFCSLLFLLPFSVRASGQTFISEIAWAGSSASLADEWFELCGSPGTDISNWSIEGASASPIVIAGDSVMPASGIFLIANYANDDAKSVLSAVPDVVTSVVSLSNSNQFISLRDASGTLIDVAGAEGAPPFAGTSGTVKASMERLDGLLDGGTAVAWGTAATSSGFDAGAVELGTPGTCAPVLATTPVDTPVPVISATSSEIVAAVDVPIETALTTPPIKPLSSIRIGEIYPSPKSGESEWIELLNPSFMGEILEGLTIEDAKGTKAPLSDLLLPWARLVIESPRGSLNNDGDTVIIREQDGRIVERVDYPKTARGESYMRQEPQGTFVMTLTPTPGAPNVLTVAESVPVAIAPSETAKPATETVHLGLATPQSAVAAITIPISNDAAIQTKDAPQLAVKTSTKKTAVKPKTSAVSKYKGVAYAATVVVPPGVYSKTRSYVRRDDSIEELRLSKGPNSAWNVGDKISFVAQNKTEGAISYLLANVNSVRRTGSASATFTSVESWPEDAGGYRFTAEVLSLRGNALEVKLGGEEGDVLVPAGTAASLNPGDKVSVEGFVIPGARPQVVLPYADALRLNEAHIADDPATPYRSIKLPTTLAIGLMTAAGLAGLAAYLRASRLKRLALTQTKLNDMAIE